MPTTLGLNMQELQNWQQTKQASAKPMAQRVMMNVAESVTMDMLNTAQQELWQSSIMDRMMTAALQRSARGRWDQVWMFASVLQCRCTSEMMCPGSTLFLSLPVHPYHA